MQFLYALTSFHSYLMHEMYGTGIEKNVFFHFCAILKSTVIKKRQNNKDA